MAEEESKPAKKQAEPTGEAAPENPTQVDGPDGIQQVQNEVPEDYVKRASEANAEAAAKANKAAGLSEEDAVLRQSPAGRSAVEGEVKITLADGDTVKVPGSVEGVQNKLRGGNLVEFRARGEEDSISVNPAHVRKVEAA